jgi:hypothetical protein
MSNRPSAFCPVFEIKIAPPFELHDKKLKLIEITIKYLLSSYLRFSVSDLIRTNSKADK